MEKVKFRVWDEILKYMVSVKTLHFNEDGELVNVCPQYRGKSLHKDYKLMQYTGLDDKNGKEIYIGDIVKFDDYDESIIETVGFLDLDLWPICIYGHNPLRYELLGNIHENPELLGEVKK